jgi:hypothetical protein
MAAPVPIVTLALDRNSAAVPAARDVIQNS